MLNLDALKAADLEAFHKDATEDTLRTAMRLFPKKPYGYRDVTYRLGFYAALRGANLLAREGKLTGLCHRQEAKLADMYARFPSYARWR